jgi:hypothetical protein
MKLSVRLWRLFWGRTSRPPAFWRFVSQWRNPVSRPLRASLGGKVDGRWRIQWQYPVWCCAITGPSILVRPSVLAFLTENGTRCTACDWWSRRAARLEASCRQHPGGARQTGCGWLRRTSNSLRRCFTGDGPEGDPVSIPNTQPSERPSRRACYDRRTVFRFRCNPGVRVVRTLALAA